MKTLLPANTAFPRLQLMRTACAAQRSFSAAMRAHAALIDSAVDLANESDDLEAIIELLHDASTNANTLQTQAQQIAERLRELSNEVI